MTSVQVCHAAWLERESSRVLWSNVKFASSMTTKCLMDLANWESMRALTPWMWDTVRNIVSHWVCSNMNCVASSPSVS
jgi:hypothetical protein